MPTPAKTRRSAKPAKAVKPALPTPAWPSLEAAAPLLNVAKELRRWTDNLLGVAGSAGELSLNLAKARAGEPRERERIDQAATMLRQARETAGMSTRELSQAIGLDDPKLLQQAEGGTVALPFEVVLRLAGVLGRHDPSTFAMKLARSYNPTLWKALDDLGIGKLVALAGRERELANLYRGNDDARRLSDEGFAEVLAFTKTAFDMAVRFRVAPGGKAARRGDAAAA
ncbi:MAG: helix-turn-helix transcriptional regulator [Proteobacteria bacterium]|jgi:transcriptional regulator with XRE-family HTH domain|nr:helix-turn-helix transcriptional regulator [Pseudomonadota bacterium]